MKKILFLLFTLTFIFPTSVLANESGYNNSTQTDNLPGIIMCVPLIIAPPPHIIHVTLYIPLNEVQYYLDNQATIGGCDQENNGENGSN